MNDQLTGLRGRVEEALAEAADAQSLEALRVRMLGKKGEITQILKSLGALEPERRREVGQEVNDIRKFLEQKLEEAGAAISTKRQAEALLSEKIDVTLPGKRREIGHRHPLTLTLEKMVAFFIGMGFTVAEGPHIETAFYNFEALNIPKDHPTRDEQDTFYCTEDIVLRTHTSPVQVRYMEKHQPPIRIVSPGKAFRSDDIDATHTPVFHQLEGLVVDKGITLGDLRGILDAFAKYMFGEEMKTRIRPSFFPFTEPSAEVDVTCHVCKGNITNCYIICRFINCVQR